jgi:hypothetical protein
MSAGGESIVFSCLPCDMILIGLVFVLSAYANGVAPDHLA